VGPLADRFGRKPVLLIALALFLVSSAACAAASSLLGVLPFSLGALVSAVLGAAFDGTARPLALAIALAGAGAFASERLLFGPAARAAKAARHG
jgi:MFS family permease